jgi:hypothetical protein
LTAAGFPGRREASQDLRPAPGGQEHLFRKGLKR